MSFTPVGVAFNGVDTKLTRAAIAAGDSPTATVSYWIRKDNTDYGVVYSNPDSSVSADGQNNPSVFLFDTANANGVNWNNVVTINDNVWHHVIASVDYSAGRYGCYIDGQPETSPTIVGTPGTVHLGAANWAVGEQLSSPAKWHGDIAELFISTGYLDLSTPANLQKFYNAGAIDLGDDGSIPFGSKPLVYLSVRAGDAASGFAVNRGTGGDFTISGTLDLSGSGPNTGIVRRGGAGRSRRKYIVLKDGTHVFPKTDVEFRSIVAALVAEAMPDLPKEQAPVKRKPGRKPKNPTVSYPVERWNRLFAALAALETRAITESAILQAALEDDEDVIALLLH